MTLTVAYTQTLGDRVFDIAFETGPGVTALFGPSGAGKTSVVNAVAGLSRGPPLSPYDRPAKPDVWR
jgi:molybdate transport system ATP-binding protein